MWNLRHLLFDDERGQGLVEYAFIILFVAIACIGAVTAFGGTVAGSIADSAAQLFP